jgi:YfiH family protein
MTDEPAVTLFMRFADCVPILLYDTRNKAVGIVHAGWRGTVQNAAGAAIRAMMVNLGSSPGDIWAGIGPSIGPDHYEVGQEVIERVRLALGEEGSRVLLRVNGATHLDLWEANRLQLDAIGVGQVDLSGLCTACHPDDWYSHRGENGKTGRFGAVIGLEANEKPQ